MSRKQQIMLVSTYYLFAVTFSLFVALQFEFRKGASGNANPILVYSQLVIAAYAIYGIILWSINSSQYLILRLTKAALLAMPLVVLSCLNQWFLAGGKMNIAYSDSLIRYGSTALFKGPMTVMSWSMLLIVLLSYVKNRRLRTTDIEPIDTQFISNPNRIIRSTYAILAFISAYAYMPFLYPDKYHLYLSQLWIELQRMAESNDIPMTWYLAIFLLRIFGSLLISVILTVLIFSQAHYFGRILDTLKKRFSISMLLTCLAISTLTLGSVGFVLYVEGQEFIDDTFRQPKLIYWQLKLTFVFSVISMGFLLALKVQMEPHVENRRFGVFRILLRRVLLVSMASRELKWHVAENSRGFKTKKRLSQLLVPSCWSLALTANLIMIVALTSTSFSSSLHAELVKLKTSSSYYRTLTLEDFVSAQKAGWKEEVPDFPLKAPGFFPRSTR